MILCCVFFFFERKMTDVYCLVSSSVAQCVEPCNVTRFSFVRWKYGGGKITGLYQGCIRVEFAFC